MKLGLPFKNGCQALRLALLVAGFVFAGCGVAHGDIFLVTNTADSGPGSLRWAITNANANAGADTIDFQITGTPPFTINPLSALPAVTGPVTINGTTQTGWVVSGTPMVELDGAAAGTNAVGLELDSASNRVMGLAINRFGAQGILLNGAANVIEGDFIGTDITGTIARGNGSDGILVESQGNIIGGVKVFNRNVISGNHNAGIYFYNASSNTVQGNYIGLSFTGTNALGNDTNGIVIYGSGGNLVGGGPGARNFISGNGVSGVFLAGTATKNVIQGNYIGADVSGGRSVGNAKDGVTMDDAPSNSVIGNLISGNGANGIFLAGSGPTGDVVAGNYIGTDAAGKLAVGNGDAGVIVGGSGNFIGWTNVISGNAHDGVFLVGGGAGNIVQGNLVGLSAAGTNAVPNGGNGVEINGSSSNMIGGVVSQARNVISGNNYNGVGIIQLSDTGNTVCGNYIGTDFSGERAVANVLAGVLVNGCSNVIGGAEAGSGNVISGNGQQGIYLVGTNGNVTGNVIQGNFIGLDAAGAHGLGNGNAGIGLNEAADTQIGGPTAAARNVISANGSSSGFGGIFLANPGTMGNQLQGNYIGTDATGTIALGNVHDGIYLAQAAANTIGGSAAGAGNLISANGVDGIYLTNASWNVIEGNYIGTKADGVGALGNTDHNVELDINATNNFVGGPAAGQGNRIAFALTPMYSGVRVRIGSLNNLISGNSIFSNANLGIDLGNFGVNPNVNCESGVAANAANRGQNYPVLTNAVSGSATRIGGAFDSAPGKSYTLQFFSSPSTNAAGYGQGQVFLGQTNLVLGASCSTNFTVSLPVSVPAGWIVTATASDPANNTSEFSAWIRVVKVPQVVPGAANQTNRRISLSWTNNGDSYVLQQTFSLVAPQRWKVVTNTLVLTNGCFVLTLPATNQAVFYRLATQ